MLMLSTTLYYFAMLGSEAATHAELPRMKFCASETEINGICYGEFKKQDHLTKFLECECDETIFEIPLNIGANRILFVQLKSNGSFCDSSVNPTSSLTANPYIFET